MIYGNAIITRKEPQTYIFEDASGKQVTGVYVDKETIFTATDNDVRKGLVYAGDNGKSTGSKVIPSYNTSEGVKYIPAGSSFVLKIFNYDYTKLQALMCAFNTSMSDSVFTDKVGIEGSVYNTQSTEILSSITVDHINASINFGLTNTSDTPYLIRYFTYKEIY